ncbi:RagB/SusD family nutrient uptake outer membrane protein [Capnocytophaga stomatis]|uniref:RagB/SusD family nutrient uptake outer membrane protein n=1 Tax=Capnocytophaga stomatis TaxID=1848904 RepID=UPI001AC61121|nr:RagB/SusD family nutrient uptake outer membrane protein [Capnocytophaga stomatis]GIM49935.1 hypothetical protein CAPN003_13870 [Capnocytophaga stomatis]
MKKIFFLTVFAGVMVSCDKYLDIEPKGHVIPNTIEDYDLLLNGIHTISNEEVLALTADDYKMYSYGSSVQIDTKNPDSQSFQLFSWGEFRFYSPTQSVSAWNSPYSNIYTCNKIINEVMQAAPSLRYSETDKPQIQAEAYYNRALDYFYLVNIFAKAYSASASSDLAVPIVTVADATQTTFPRATVAEVYDFIISDLEKALKNLPTKSKAIVRPNMGSAYSLLSRVYLYKGDYEKSLEYANKAIDFNGTLQSYLNSTRETIGDEYRLGQYSMRYFGGTAGYQGGLSDDLKSVLSTTNDSRYYSFYRPHPNYGEFKITYKINPNAGASIGEMYVTRAECYARLGKKDLAITDLNTLRAKRLKEHTPLQEADFNTDKELIKFCLEERRRETFMSHLRLLDIKRMNLEPDYAITITKQFQGETYTAEPNSGKLVLPIPAQVLKFNPSWKNN